MTSDHELRQTLDDLGRSAPPAPDPAFANRLEANLRQQHQEQAAGRRRPIFAPVALGLAGVAVLIIAVISFSFGGQEPAVVVLTAAAETDVVLPGETAAPGVVGQRLPDGTRIVVSPDGEAVVGGVVLGPGAEAVVVAGRIEVLRIEDPQEALTTTTVPILRPSVADQSTTPSTTRDRASDGSTTVTEDRAVDGTAATASTDDRDQPTTSPSTTVTPTASPSTASPSTASASTTAPSTTRSTTTSSATERSTTSTRPTTTGRPATTTTRPQIDPSIDLVATASGPDRIVLDWVLDGGLGGSDQPAGWRIEAVAGDRVTTLAVLRDGRARTATVARIEARGVGFRVVIVDADGGDLLASEVSAQPAG